MQIRRPTRRDLVPLAVALSLGVVLPATAPAQSGAADSSRPSASAPKAAAPSKAAAPRSAAPRSAAPRSAAPARKPASATAKRDTTKAAAPKAPPKPRADRPEPVWPVKGPEPLPGSILPGKRIVAYYGNPLSKKMGILGEIPPEQMLARLEKEAAAWHKSDPATPVQPALHFIGVVAQGGPGKDGKYRLRMDSALVEKVYGWAKSRNAILFIDIQVGQSTLQEELPRLTPFLARPDVHLGVDPEFSMHYASSGRVPGTKIGTMMAADINHATSFLADLVTKHKIPPKVLVVHRFTRNMVPNAEAIRLDPRVQIVMNMDGWGPPWLKRDSYRDYIYQHPVQFTGFKLFYHNDTKKGHPLMSPDDVLKLNPKPVYIQYQ